jgi:hypothetical protein
MRFMMMIVADEQSEAGRSRDPQPSALYLRDRRLRELMPVARAPFTAERLVARAPSDAPPRSPRASPPPAPR